MSSPLMLVAAEPELAGRGDLVVGSRSGASASSVRAAPATGRAGRRRAAARMSRRSSAAGEPVVVPTSSGSLRSVTASRRARIATTISARSPGESCRWSMATGARQQPAVGADDVERPVVGEAEVVDAGVGGVEQPQPDQLGGHVEVGAGGAVDQRSCRPGCRCSRTARGWCPARCRRTSCPARSPGCRRRRTPRQASPAGRSGRRG